MVQVRWLTWRKSSVDEIYTIESLASEVYEEHVKAPQLPLEGQNFSNTHIPDATVRRTRAVVDASLDAGRIKHSMFIC